MVPCANNAGIGFAESSGHSKSMLLIFNPLVIDGIAACRALFVAVHVQKIYHQQIKAGIARFLIEHLHSSPPFDAGNRSSNWLMAEAADV